MTDVCLGRADLNMCVSITLVWCKGVKHISTISRLLRNAIMMPAGIIHCSLSCVRRQASYPITRHPNSYFFHPAARRYNNRSLVCRRWKQGGMNWNWGKGQWGMGRRLCDWIPLHYLRRNVNRSMSTPYSRLTLVLLSVWLVPPESSSRPTLARVASPKLGLADTSAKSHHNFTAFLPAP